MICGMFITDGLARYGIDNIYNPGSLFGRNFSVTRLASSNDSVETPNGCLRWDFQVWRWGYSYGIRNITTKLSLALLLTHTALDLGFMIYLCLTGWRTTAWSSIGELIALALKSQPTHQFQGIDAGISRSRTWAQNVRTREMGNGGLQMRFEEDGCDEDQWEPVKRVGLGKKYGRDGKHVKSYDM